MVKNLEDAEVLEAFMSNYSETGQSNVEIFAVEIQDQLSLVGPIFYEITRLQRSLTARSRPIEKLISHTNQDKYQVFTKTSSPTCVTIR